MNCPCDSTSHQHSDPLACPLNAPRSPRLHRPRNHRRNPVHDCVNEIGIVEIDGDKVSRWSTLVNPRRSIPKFIQHMTGIGNAMVADAPTFDQVAAKLGRRLQGRLVNGLPRGVVPVHLSDADPGR